ncbi:MAG TPA: hypothetical protein VKB92_02325 [Myxococcales bacterium]|nr:hypothetical protein [Myxococcales bacterium]
MNRSLETAASTCTLRNVLRAGCAATSLGQSRPRGRSTPAAVRTLAASTGVGVLRSA